MTVKWQEPIEVYSEGKWVPAHVVEHDTRSTQFPYRLAYMGYLDQWHDADGKSCCSDDYVRNIGDV